MEDEREADTLSGACALEHLTGPSRGTVTWLGGAILDITLDTKRLLHVSEAPPGEPPENLVARLLRTGDCYEITAPEGRRIWVNGDPITVRKLEHYDVIEFDEAGPLSRFHRFRQDWPTHKMAADILKDSIVYFRLSRRPLASRILLTIYGLLRRLTRETTHLFRIGVVLSIVVLAILSYQQYRLNILIKQQIETGSTRLESIAGALSRAREEALTPADLKELRQELATRMQAGAERLSILERRSDASVRVIADSLPSIMFLQGAYGFRERSSGRMLRKIVDHDGNPLVTPIGQPLLSLEGDGPVAERLFTGTGFAVGDGRVLVTNRHVAQPWENDAIVESMANQGLEPVMTKYIAYAPGNKTASAVELVKMSEEADLAILQRKDAKEQIPGLKLADTQPDTGDEIIVMGYPTGLRSMLVQSGERFIDELLKSEDTGFWTVAARLAGKGFIAPLASRGIISKKTPATIVYDAETTLGGSGGPVLDLQGSVVAISVAVLPEYGGSNFAVPVAKLNKMLEEAGLH